MRRNANSSAPLQSSIPSGARCTLALLALAALAWTAAVPTAAAAEPAPEFLVQFGETGEGAGQLNNPRGIAPNPKTGNVYVADLGNRRLSEFTPWGRFVKAFGWDVAPGTVNEQQEVRVRAAHGQFKLIFGAGGVGVSETDNLKFNASASEVETALNALTNISSGAGEVAVSANPGTPDGATPYIYVVIFKGAFAGTNVTTQLSAVNGTEGLSGGSPATTVEASTRANGTVAGTGLEDCTAESGCKAGTNGTGVGQLSNALGVAVDSNGDIYVVDQTNRRVQKYNSAGEFLLMFGGNVDKGGGTPANPGNLCTAAYVANGDNCTGVASTGIANGFFEAWQIGDFIAVDAGHVYVGDKERIQKFSSGGIWEENIDLSSPSNGFVRNFALDLFGNRYVASQSIAGVQKLGFGSPYPLDTGGAPKALATDAAGNLYVSDTTTGFTPDEIIKYSSTGVKGPHFGTPENPQVALGNGLATNVACPAPATPAPGDVYASYFKSTAPGAASYVSAYGLLPNCFESPPSVPPTIAAEYATAVGTSSAVVKAEINPHFFATHYYVEFGAADCEASPCAQQPAPPGIALNGQRDRIYPTSGVPLSGLTPGVVYHYRFVAVSTTGTVFGPDRTFRTALPGAFALPDGRAFEMVSPPDKKSAEVAVPGSAGGLTDSVEPLQASSGGEAITYPSFTAFGDAQSAPAASQYLSKRGPSGWSTENISPPDQEGGTRDPLRGFSADLSVGAVIQREPILAPGAVAGYENLYLRDNESGSLLALTTATPRGTAPEERYCVSYAGASANSDHVIFVANGALTPDAPEAPRFSLYEWSAGGLSLVSVLPGDVPAQPSTNTSFGAAGNGCAMNAGIVRNAISAGGSRIFWTYSPPGEPTETQLLARLNGTDTIRLDAPQGGPGPAGRGKFWAASADGSKVFFTCPHELTADASAGDLYEYDVDTETLTDITVDPTPGSDPAAVQGVLGASEDGSYVYFVANGVLDAGATAGKPNLYVWHVGEAPHFVATLLATDASSWNEAPNVQTARVAPDGRHLAFLSAASLAPPYDNVDLGTGKPDSEVYLYDFESKALACVSCNPSGARPAGPAALPVWNTPYEQPRYLSDDGGRLFFESFDTLALPDTNGKRDVYEFERGGVGGCSAQSAAFSASSGGCIYLISTGANGDESYFLDASSDGRDVFVSTRQRLVAADEDERFDVYDARIGGGFPPAPPPPPTCLGEACRPAQAAPTVTSPASSGIVGEGNVNTRRHHRNRHCPKGRRQIRRHGKVRCVKRSGGHRRAHRSGRAAS